MAAIYSSAVILHVVEDEIEDIKVHDVYSSKRLELYLYRCETIEI
jgi:hypothetical protein